MPFACVNHRLMFGDFRNRQIVHQVRAPREDRLRQRLKLAIRGSRELGRRRLKEFE
jgi:hypothetical protein